MKRSKGFISIIVALAVLTLVVSTVFAQSEPPGRTPPPLGGDLIPDAAPSPAMSFIQYDTTPDFRFTELAGATKYKIEVYNSYDNALLYTYKGAGVCEGGYCTLTPSTTLGIYKWNSTTGRYNWHVKAKYGGSWQTSWSGNSGIFVLSDGFVSTFNADKKGWKPLNGDWSLDSSAYLKDSGSTAGKWHSVYQKNFTWDFIYQVRMKRPAGNDMIAITFWGIPVLDPVHGDCWTDGIYFQYTNLQDYSIWRTVGDSWEFVVSPTHSDAIRPYQWNTLTVVVYFPYQYYYINGNYLGWTDIASMGSGWAGIGYYPTAVGQSLLIDKATLEAINMYSTLTPDPAMKLGNEPIPGGLVPGQMPAE